MKEKFIWYKHKRTKLVHKRAESWFNSSEKEKVYEEAYIRIKSEKDKGVYVKPKPKPKKKKSTKKKDRN